MSSSHRREWGLALAAARTRVAHVGVIRALERAGVQPIWCAARRSVLWWSGLCCGRVGEFRELVARAELFGCALVHGCTFEWRVIKGER